MHRGYEKVNYVEGFSPKIRHVYLVGVGSDLLGEEESKKTPKGSQVELNVRTQLSGTFLEEQVCPSWCPMNPVHSSADIFDCRLDLFPVLLFVFFAGRDNVEISLAVICG